MTMDFVACRDELSESWPEGAACDATAGYAASGANAIGREGAGPQVPAAVRGARLYRDGLRRILNESLLTLSGDKQKRTRKKRQLP